MSPSQIVVVLWLAFYACWFAAALGVKKNVRTQGNWQRSALRIAIIVAIILVIRVPIIRHAFEHYRNANSGTVRETFGIVLCLCGFSFAIWARLHLGRNWGQPMTLKEGHELITTGPYRFIRHPIYTGILVAMFGSTLVNPFWLVPFVFLTGYFVYSARTEERIMMEQFPATYPDYKKRTGALVPFL